MNTEIRFHLKQKTLTNIISYLILIVFTLAYMIPFYIVLVTSFKANNQIATAQPFIWFLSGEEFSFSAYVRVFTTYTIFSTGRSMILTGFVNTLTILVPVIVVGMFSSTIAAYAFAKLRFKGKKIMFNLLLFSMMLPGIILLIPSYFIYDNIGLTDTFFPLMVPAMFGSATAVFFLRQSIVAIPNEVIDAAKVDGLNSFGVFWHIIIPLAKPAIIAQTILGILAIYNDYLNPLIYLISEEKYTLQIALAMFSTGNGTDMPVVMAGSILSMIPMLIIYFLLQKYFISGITMSGMKD